MCCRHLRSIDKEGVVTTDVLYVQIGIIVNPSWGHIYNLLVGSTHRTLRALELQRWLDDNILIYLSALARLGILALVEAYKLATMNMGLRPRLTDAQKQRCEAYYGQ